MAEGLPTASRESKEPLITEEACVAAMRDGNFKLAGKWYAQQEEVVSLDTSPHGHLQLTVLQAHLQFESRAVDPETGELWAFATLSDAGADAFHRREDKNVAQIDEMLSEMRWKWKEEELEQKKRKE